MLATVPPPHLCNVWIFPGTGGTPRKRGAYQRFIITCMAQQVSSITKRVLARQMAKKFGMSLRNAYTHTYTELNCSLIPGGIVEQDGAVPATRGPRIFQLDGVPCFRLSGLGMLLACSLDEIDIKDRMQLFRQYLDSDRSWRRDPRKGELLSHLEAYPEFTLELLKQGAAQYLQGKADHPLSLFPTRKSPAPARRLRYSGHGLP
ncbi:MAG: hypothetical protein ABI348_05295 [Nitrososphaera sp.]|jgi:hypothetical protein